MRKTRRKVTETISAYQLRLPFDWGPTLAEDGAQPLLEPVSGEPAAPPSAEAVMEQPATAPTALLADAPAPAPDPAEAEEAVAIAAEASTAVDEIALTFPPAHEDEPAHPRTHATEQPAEVVIRVGPDNPPAPLPPRSPRPEDAMNPVTPDVPPDVPPAPSSPPTAAPVALAVEAEVEASPPAASAGTASLPPQDPQSDTKVIKLVTAIPTRRTARPARLPSALAAGETAAAEPPAKPKPGLRLRTGAPVGEAAIQPVELPPRPVPLPLDAAALAPAPAAAVAPPPPAAFAPPAVGSASMQIGLSLKQRREELKLELSDVAKSTHIRTDYIRLIENGQAATLPVAPIYTRSYVKSLCRTYNLDPEPLVTQLNPELPLEPLLATASQRALVLEAASEEQPEPATEPAAGPATGHAMRWLVISLVMVAAAVVLVTAISRNVRRNIPVSDAPPLTSADLQQYLVPELLEPTALDVPR